MKPKAWDKAQQGAINAQRQRIETIMSRYSKGHAIADIARDLDVTRQRISQIVNRELRRAGAK